MSYFVHEKGQTSGPYTIEQLRSMWVAGEITDDTLYCEEHYDQWFKLDVLLDESGLSPPRTPVQPPIIEPPPLLLSVIPQRKALGGRLLFAGLMLGLLVLVGVLGRSLLSDHNTQVAATPQPDLPRRDDGTVTEEYAREINAFAEEHDMTVEEVMRWKYVLASRGFNLRDLQQVLTRIGELRDRAAGYHVEVKRHNRGGRRLVIGDATPPQNPTLSETEESVINVLKLAGY